MHLNNSLLKFKNLTISFQNGDQENTAVSNVSFSLIKGEILAIVGESGSGKSVTSLSAMGLLGKGGSYKSGEIIYTDRKGSSTDFLRLSNKNNADSMFILNIF